MVSLDNLNALYSSRTARDWQANLAALTLCSGFSQFFFGMVKDRSASFEGAFICTNYDCEWRRKYDEQQMHCIDPVVAHCARNIVPLVWETSIFAGQQQIDFHEQACSYGLRSGVSFPMHGLSGEFGIISFADEDESREFDFESLSALALIRDFAFESSLRFLNSPEPDAGAAPVRLTVREHDCLQWVMRGKTSWETSKILGCSETTVNFHVSNANRKLGVKTRQQAVMKAIRLKLIRADQ